MSDAKRFQVILTLKRSLDSSIFRWTEEITATNAAQASARIGQKIGRDMPGVYIMEGLAHCVSHPEIDPPKEKTTPTEDVEVIEVKK
jgi:hypothetical protein